MNNISHLRTAPFHPQSNGLAERAVRTVKDGIKKMRGENLETNLVRMLFNYRITPQASGRSPSEVLLGYQIRSRIDTCFPSVARDARNDHPGWNFAPGDPVYFRNYGDGDNWTPGQVKSTSGSRMLTVSMPSKVVHRHADQVRRRIPEEDHLLDQQAENVSVLGTDEATTCLMAIVRHTGSGAVSLAHFDGSGLEQGAAAMVRRVQELSLPIPEGRFEVYIVGGFLDRRGYSETLANQLLYAFHKQPVNLHLVTACICASHMSAVVLLMHTQPQ
ncbi:hypothetical protein ISCGN_022627 [Ixodes scapularis]